MNNKNGVQLSQLSEYVNLEYACSLDIQELGPVPQNFPNSIPKFLPKLTFKNLKHSRWISWSHAFEVELIEFVVEFVVVALGCESSWLELTESLWTCLDSETVVRSIEVRLSL